QLYGYLMMRLPEFETVRALEEHEVFASRVGDLWIQDGQGVRLGEIAADIVANSHGEIVPDLAERAVQRVTDLVIAEVERRCSAPPFQDILVTVHDVVDQRRSLELWYHDILGIATDALARLRL